MPETPTLNALIDGLMNLAVDITKAHKAHSGVAGYVDQILKDEVVINDLKLVISNISALSTEVKSMNLTDAIMLVRPVVRGVEAIIKETNAPAIAPVASQPTV